jgi:Secretion system C-terminal sorting domain
MTQFFVLLLVAVWAIGAKGQVLPVAVSVVSDSVLSEGVHAMTVDVYVGQPNNAPMVQNLSISIAYDAAQIETATPINIDFPGDWSNDFTTKTANDDRPSGIFSIAMSKQDGAVQALGKVATLTFVVIENVDGKGQNTAKTGLNLRSLSAKYTPLAPSIYPTKLSTFGGVLYLKTASEALTFIAVLYDAMGQEITAQPINTDRQTINIPALAAGNYFLKIQDETGIFTQKITVID